MATDQRRPAPRDRVCKTSRARYLLSADQVLKMVAAGIIREGEGVELWDGVLYVMTKGETHNFIVGQAGDLIRPLLPDGFHLREEKSARRGEWSLPEPDLGVCRGARGDFWPDLPTLEHFVMLVEVNHHSETADRIDKLAAYAEAGVPVYWVVDVADRSVAVYTDPARPDQTRGRYATLRTARAGETVDVVVDGETRGSVSVDDLFPLGPKG